MRLSPLRSLRKSVASTGSTLELDKGQHFGRCRIDRSSSSISFEDINVATGSTHFMSVTFSFLVFFFGIFSLLGFLFLFSFSSAGLYPSRRKKLGLERVREKRRTDMEKRDAAMGEFRPASSDMEGD